MHNSVAGGLYGITYANWHALGYPGLPPDAPVSQQNQAALRIYLEAGQQAWAPSDWR